MDEVERLALVGEVVMESGKLRARFDYRHSKSVLRMVCCWLVGRISILE